MAILAGLMVLRLTPKLSLRVFSFSHSRVASVFLEKNSRFRFPVSLRLGGTSTHQGRAELAVLDLYGSKEAALAMGQYYCHLLPLIQAKSCLLLPLKDAIFLGESILRRGLLLLWEQEVACSNHAAPRGFRVRSSEFRVPSTLEAHTRHEKRETIT